MKKLVPILLAGVIGFLGGRWSVQPEDLAEALFQVPGSPMPQYQEEEDEEETESAQKNTPASTAIPETATAKSLITLESASIAELRRVLNEREETFEKKYLAPRFPAEAGPQSKAKADATARRFFKDYRNSDGSNHWKGSTTIFLAGQEKPATALLHYYDSRMTSPKNADLRELDDDTALCWWIRIRIGANDDVGGSSCFSSATLRDGHWWSALPARSGSIPSEYSYYAIEFPLQAQTLSGLELFRDTAKRWIPNSETIRWESVSKDEYEKLETLWREEDEPKDPSP